jgi:predicted DNA-binding transcriptional regulator AlpA
MNLEERTFTIPKAAAIAGCGRSTMYEYVNTRQVEGVRQFGRTRKITESGLKEFIRLHTVRSAEDEELVLKIEAEAKKKGRKE